METLIFIIILLVFGFYSYPLYVYFVFVGVYSLIYFDTNILYWLVFGSIALVFLKDSIRLEYISKKIVNFIKKNNLLPKISKTEKEALEAGTNWVESNFFKAEVDFKRIKEEKITVLSEEEQSFLDNEVNTLCEMTSDWEIFQDRDFRPDVWKYIKDNKFFGMIIPKKYGGLGFSATAHSHIIEKLVSRSQVLAITIMVPNSLGPAELILKHGTQKQKDKYLANLAIGKDIPCFALTEPNAGSDATSITSYGILFKDEHDGQIKIRLNFEKRYITLANIATLIGLAFVLEDPDHLLGEEEHLGITFGLIDASSHGVDNSRRHDPVGIPFVNSPLIGKDVIIGLENIIGEKDGIGHGWKMLVESLSIGRGISLPSVSLGGSKLALNVVSSYTQLREQFGLSLNHFEAIEEKIAKIASYTYMLNAARNYTLDAIDNGEKPGVVNSIMKYHATEKFREIINDSMDVLGGSAIMRGKNNLLAHAYFAIPISITVEGANILTRNLMQFGQGLIKSHPYITREINALESNNIEKFDKAFFAHISLVYTSFTKTLYYFFTRAALVPNLGEFSKYKRKLLWVSAFYTLITNVALALIGPALKKSENLSGRFGDILSYSYLVTAVLREYDNKPVKEHRAFVDHFCSYAFYEIQLAFEEIFANMTLLKVFVPILRLNPISLKADDKLNAKILKELNNQDTVDTLCNGIFISEDHNDRLHIIQKALKINKLYDKQFKMIKKEVKQKALKQDRMENIIKEAYEKNFISKDEFENMLEAYRLKQIVISVDSFDIGEYKDLK
ncbi:MAG: acyl-CoA dehydrogenase [Campylobacterales bacterium]|nr:acyl-CoA dehydrogenase [Campylobacterales bacterium]